MLLTFHEAAHRAAVSLEADLETLRLTHNRNMLIRILPHATVLADVLRYVVPGLPPKEEERLRGAIKKVSGALGTTRLAASVRLLETSIRSVRCETERVALEAASVWREMLAIYDAELPRMTGRTAKAATRSRQELAAILDTHRLFLERIARDRMATDLSPASVLPMARSVAAVSGDDTNSAVHTKPSPEGSLSPQRQPFSRSDDGQG
jgi:hypothetical protein